MNLSVLFSSFLLATYGDMLSGQQRITEMSIVILFIFGVYTLWAFVDACVPVHTNSFTIMAERRKRAMALLHETMSDAMHTGLQSTSSEPFQRRVTATLTAIGDGDWDAIKKSSDAEEAVQYA